MLKRILAITALMFTLSALAEDVYQTIKLQNRSAENMQALLTPLLPKACSTSGDGYQLILKCSPQQMQQLTDLVSKLDQPEDSLVIRFKQIKNADFNAQNDSYDPVVTYSTQPNSNQMQEREIKVQDGKEAYIAFGESFPYQNFFVGLFGVGFDQQYKDVMSGFTVKPDVHGNQVTLNVEWKFDDLARSGSAWERRKSTINKSQTSTSVNLPLGEWVDISQYGTKSYIPQEESVVYDTRNVTKPETHLLIRVDLAPHAHQASEYYDK